MSDEKEQIEELTRQLEPLLRQAIEIRENYRFIEQNPSEPNRTLLSQLLNGTITINGRRINERRKYFLIEIAVRGNMLNSFDLIYAAEVPDPFYIERILMPIAAEKGHIEILRRLMKLCPRCSPTFALQSAEISHRQDVIDFINSVLFGKDKEEWFGWSDEKNDPMLNLFDTLDTIHGIRPRNENQPYHSAWSDRFMEYLYEPETVNLYRANPRDPSISPYRFKEQIPKPPKKSSRSRTSKKKNKKK